jgi:hypothetical protein
MGCERLGVFQHLYGMLRAAAIHVGKSPNCHRLGLGVLEISIAAGTGADVIAGGTGAAVPAIDVRHQPPGCPYPVYFCKPLHNMECPNTKWDE